MTVSHYDVAVVGAGMVGSSLACALAHAGFRVALVDAGGQAVDSDWPADGVDTRVSALTPATQHLLQHLGVWSAVEDMARLQPFRAMQIWDGCGTQSIEFRAANLHRVELGFIVENRCITVALHRQLAQHKSITTYMGTRLQALSPPESTTGRRLTLANGACLTANLIAGADGAYSSSRQLAGFTLREWDYPHHAIITRVQVEQSHQATAWQRFTEDGILAFLPLPPLKDNADKHYCSIVWSVPPLRATTLMALDDSQFCQTLAAAFEHRLGPVLTADARQCIPLRQRHAKQYAKPGMVLLGDAAHTIHPLAGQGVNLGFLDVATLTDVLVVARDRGADFASLAVLQRYQRRRQRENLQMMVLMEGFARLYGNHNIWAGWLRNTSMGWLQRLTPIKQYLMQRAMGLGPDLPPLARADAYAVGQPPAGSAPTHLSAR